MTRPFVTHNNVTRRTTLRRDSADASGPSGALGRPHTSPSRPTYRTRTLKSLSRQRKEAGHPDTFLLSLPHRNGDGSVSPKPLRFVSRNPPAECATPEGPLSIPPKEGSHKTVNVTNIKVHPSLPFRLNVDPRRPLSQTRRTLTLRPVDMYVPCHQDHRNHRHNVAHHSFVVRGIPRGPEKSVAGESSSTNQVGYLALRCSPSSTLNGSGLDGRNRRVPGTPECRSIPGPTTKRHRHLSRNGWRQIGPNRNVPSPSRATTLGTVHWNRRETTGTVVLVPTSD